jgi:hypothetical protein
LAATVASLGILARKRHEAEKQAGQTLLQLAWFHELDPFTSPPRRRLRVFGMGLAATVAMLLFSSAIANRSSGLPWIQEAFLTG